MRRLLEIAEEQGIEVYYFNFQPALLAVYTYYPDYGYLIGLDGSLVDDKPTLRVVMAHELGHHFTCGITDICSRQTTYSQRLSICFMEREASNWAAHYLMPLDKVIAAVESEGISEYVLSDEFYVPVWFARYRMEMADFRSYANRRFIAAESGADYQ